MNSSRQSSEWNDHGVSWEVARRHIRQMWPAPLTIAERRNLQDREAAVTPEDLYRRVCLQLEVGERELIPYAAADNLCDWLMSARTSKRAAKMVLLQWPRSVKQTEFNRAHRDRLHQANALIREAKSRCAMTTAVEGVALVAGRSGD